MTIRVRRAGSTGGGGGATGCGRLTSTRTVSGSAALTGAAVTAGFEFDVPVRFDRDRLEVNLSGFRHGAIPAIPIVEIRI